VLYAGRMMAQKGAHSLLEAAPHVWETLPDARFVFLGPPTRESARWFGGADRRVVAPGVVSLQVKTDALAACDLFCMPSTSEILPTVYLEAWSFGRPVVGGMAAGLPELVERNGAGVCCPQEPEALAAALTRLLRDPGERARLGERGRALVEWEYTEAAVARRLLAVYGEIAGRRLEEAPA